MNHNNQALNPYLALFLILSSIVIATLSIQYFWYNTVSLQEFLRIFMGLFFITFASFKIINWTGFAYAFAEYDIVAQQTIIYAYAYPLIEFILGGFYLSNNATNFIHWITAIIMFTGTIGVIKSLQQDKEIQCACLGAVIKLPVSSITLIEDLGMGFMALYMIFM